MPSVTIPIVGSYGQRGIDSSAALVAAKDQRFLNCVFSVVTNPVTGKSDVYVEKRPGWGVDSTPAPGQASTGLIKPLAMNGAISAFGSMDSTLYFANTSIGTITGLANFFTETIISGVSHIAIKSSDGSGWYYVAGAHLETAYTADGNNSTTITDIKIGGVNNVTGLYVGQKLSAGANIAAGSRIVSIDSAAFSAVLDIATTGGAFNDLAITKEPIAKIIDDDFVTTGAYISAFIEMDGYLFYSTATAAGLRNSDINSVTSYAASGTIDPNMSPDEPRAVARQKSAIISFGGASKEVFTNSGNAFGSPLQRQPSLFERIGVLHQRSVTTLENEIFFVSSAYEGDIGIHRIREFQTERISTPNVDKIIGTIATSGGSFYASSFRVGGYPYAGFFLSSSSETSEALLLENADNILLETGDNILLEANPTSSNSFVKYLVYNSTLNLWSEWDCNKCTFVDSIGSGTSNQLLATSRVDTDGKIYTINPVANGELYTDDGDAYSLQVRTSKLDFGTEARKFVSKVTLMGSDIVSASTATLEYSDDDYATWTTAGTFDMSVINPIIYRCGSFQAGRAWRVTHSANTAFRAKALKFEFTVGMH